MHYKDLENKELVVWISFYLFYLLVCFRIILCISYVSCTMYAMYNHGGWYQLLLIDSVMMHQRISDIRKSVNVLCCTFDLVLESQHHH